MMHRINTVPVWLPQLPPLTVPLSEEVLQLIQQPSLTRAFKSLGGEFAVNLLYLGKGKNDTGWLEQQAGDYFIRDVLLSYNGTPVVWARSLCLSEAWEWRRILDCGTRPLGEQLFDASLAVTRSPVEYAIVGDCSLPGFDGQALLARRSVFTLNGQTLNLAECFLHGVAEIGK